MVEVAAHTGRLLAIAQPHPTVLVSCSSRTAAAQASGRLMQPIILLSIPSSFDKLQQRGHYAAACALGQYTEQ